MEYLEYVNKGMRILLAPLSKCVCAEMKKTYKNQWWNEILDVLNYPKDLPYSGSDEDLAASLDTPNCVRVLKRRWKEAFEFRLQNRSVLAWADELMGIRNIVSHKGNKDLEQPYAERALDTMALISSLIDAKAEKEIRELYQEVRASSEGQKIVYEGIAQPDSESSRGALKTGNLLQKVGTDAVIKTDLTRKVIYNEKSQIYPVYKVSLDRLFYNEQNDRIATWISGYEAENGAGSLQTLERGIFNRIIENFICESNQEAIENTQKNIMLVGQREPGVTLADGRVVDGNRRYTCLRRIQRETGEPQYFETVIMDVDIEADKKQIKMLELAIQHGEEKKVDYDLIDYAVGTYRDVVKTKLLTPEEYAANTNESVSEVKKRIRVAEIVDEYLNYLGLPEQYHIAREQQVYSIFMEMLTPLKQLSPEDQDKLKKTAFNNAFLGAVPDQRKFIRDVKTLVKSGEYQTLLKEQEEKTAELKKELAEAKIETKEELKQFADAHLKEKDDLKTSMEHAMIRTRSKQIQSKPVDSVEKCSELLMEVDPRLFDKMTDEQKEQLKKGLEELKETIAYLESSISGDRDNGLE